MVKDTNGHELKVGDIVRSFDGQHWYKMKIIRLSDNFNAIDAKERGKLGGTHIGKSAYDCIYVSGEIK